MCDRDADRSQALSDLGVVAGHVEHVKLLAGSLILAGVGGHVAVVQDDGRDRCAGADGRFDVQTGHAKGAVAHEIEAELLGFSELRADHQGDAVAEVGRLPPADVAMGYRGGVERHNRVAGVTGVVRDNAVIFIERPLQFTDHSVGVDGHVIRVQQIRPFGHPLLLDFRNRCGHIALPLTSIRAELGLDLLDEHLDGQLGVTRQTNGNVIVFVDILDALRIVQHDFPARDGLPIAGPGQTRAQGQEGVRLLNPLARLQACGGAAGA